MPTKLIAGCLLTVLCYAGGREYVGVLKKRLRMAEKYGRFAEDLASAVSFSRKSVRAYCCSASSLPGLGEWIRQSPEMSLSDACRAYRTSEKTESYCAERLTEAISLAESSSDAEHISRAFLEASEQIKGYLRELKEEYDGKMKIAPRLSLAAGAFAAVMML